MTFPGQQNILYREVKQQTTHYKQANISLLWESGSGYILSTHYLWLVLKGITKPKYTLSQQMWHEKGPSPRVYVVSVVHRPKICS